MVINNFKFHSVDVVLWMETSRFIERALLSYATSRNSVVCVPMSDSLFNALLAFREQMDIAYIHPRRDSMFLHLAQLRYSSFKVPDNHVSKKSEKKGIPSHPMKKNLSQAI